VAHAEIGRASRRLAPALATVRQSSVFRTDLDYEIAPFHEAKFPPIGQWRTRHAWVAMSMYLVIPSRYCRSGSPRLPMVSQAASAVQTLQLWEIAVPVRIVRNVHDVILAVTTHSVNICELFQRP
jgi:hypothetical protein